MENLGILGAAASFLLAANVSAPTQLMFSLRTHDTRFFSDASPVVMTVVPMIDTDQDGLSDQEEATGHDNILAVAAPAGLSNPFAFDSDGDGMSDGNEALAGTTATDAGSVFKAAAIHLTSNGWLEIVWPAIPGRFYLFEYNPGLASTNWKQLAAINALSPTLRISDTNMPAESFRMYRLGVGY